MWYKIIYVGLLIATTGFVWLYDQPLASDMPMHMALAKVYADHLAGMDSADPVYQPYFALSSYELPELLLVPLIMAFGIDLAWKIALSIYGLIFPLSVSFLVGRINPASRWTRLVGFPVTLGYFFHWGFWPFLVGFAASVVATGVSLGGHHTKTSRLTEILTRLLTFLCHPIPAFSVGIFDIVRLFRGFLPWSEHPKPSFLRAFGQLSLLWLPSIMVALIMLGSEIDAGGFRWVNLPSQIVQLLRPFYLTRQWHEFAVPLVFAAFLTYRLIKSVDIRSDQGMLILAGLVCVLIGLLIPRGRFIGSWENGARVILYGFVLIAASWALIERNSRALILGWVITGSAINLGVGTKLWSTHEPSFAWAMDILDKRFRGYRIVEEGAWTGDTGIALGNNLPIWAWCKGIATDAKNLAGIRKTGPAIYNGMTPEQRAEAKTVVLYYHPYRRSPELWEDYPEHPIYFDSGEIYSIQERLAATTESKEAENN
ncbi:hypothetical protein [Methylomagnum sp.]